MNAYVHPKHTNAFLATFFMVSPESRFYRNLHPCNTLLGVPGWGKLAHVSSMVHLSGIIRLEEPRPSILWSSLLLRPLHAIPVMPANSLLIQKLRVFPLWTSLSLTCVLEPQTVWFDLEELGAILHYKGNLLLGWHMAHAFLILENRTSLIPMFPSYLPAIFPSSFVLCHLPLTL